ncbi:MAG: hypothetical protein QME12_04950, partial [Nanoarchaeota archaeon]|nr:hypothetical protein [Nanoarchaeota archaeon]
SLKMRFSSIKVCNVRNTPFSVECGLSYSIVLTSQSFQMSFLHNGFDDKKALIPYSAFREIVQLE